MPRKRTRTLPNCKWGSACNHCKKNKQRCEWPQQDDTSGSNACVRCQQAGRTCIVDEAANTDSSSREPTSSVQPITAPGPQTIYRPPVVSSSESQALAEIGIDAVAPFSLMSPTVMDTFRLALPLELFSTLIATIGPIQCGIHATLGVTGLQSERNARLQSDLLRATARPVDSGADVKPYGSNLLAARRRPRAPQEDLLDRLLATLKGDAAKEDGHELQSEILSCLNTPWTLSTRDVTALTLVAIYAPEMLSSKINSGMVEATAITCTLLESGVLPCHWFSRGESSTYNGKNHSERIAAYLNLWIHALLFDLSTGGTCKVERFTGEDLELTLRHHPELTALVGRATRVSHMATACQSCFKRLGPMDSVEQLRSAVEHCIAVLAKESLYYATSSDTESKQDALEGSEFKFICIAEVMTSLLERLLIFMPRCKTQADFYRNLQANPRLMWIVHPLGAEQVEAAKDFLLNFCESTEEPHSIDDSRQTPGLSAFDNIASLPCRQYLTLLSAVKVVVEHDAVASTTKATSTKKMTVMLLHRVADALQGLSFYDGTDSEDAPRSAGGPRVHSRESNGYDVPKLCSVIVRGAADKCKRRMAGSSAKRQAPSTPASTSARAKSPRPSQADSEASSDLTSLATPAPSNYASSVGYSATGAWPSTSASAASPAFTTAGSESSWPMMTDELSFDLQQFINEFFGSPGGVGGDGVSSA